MMARCPFAVWKPLPENATQPHITPTQYILHTAVDHPGPTNLHGFFAREDVRVESHFWLTLDGTLFQFIDTERSADANYRANRRSDGTGAVSVETEDEGSPSTVAWSDAQLNQLVRLGRWLRSEHGIPARECRTPDDPGVGFHSMFGAPSEWTPARGKTCPGPLRIRQFPQVLQGIKGQTFQEDDDMLRQGDKGAHVAALQHRLSNWYDIPCKVDGIFGPGTATALKRWERSVGLPDDGVFSHMDPVLFGSEHDARRQRELDERLDRLES